MRVALVHDWMNQIGGAEAVLEALVRLFPTSPVFTTIYASDLMPDHWRAWDIRTTFLDRAPGIYRHHQHYLPLYPLAVDTMSVTGYDVVISNKSGFCHGVKTTENQLHIDYCLTPTRYVWEFDAYAERERMGGMAREALRPLLHWLRGWDRRAADGVDHFVAISTEIQQRIKRFYERDSVIIYPPVDTHRYRPSDDGPEDFFLVASRLIPYKRIDLAVRACSALNLPLVVVGDGRDRRALEAVAGPTVEFRGRVSDEELGWLMAHCRAFIFPGREDFGIAPVEAQAAGRPVVAFAAGGALDTVIAEETGVFFDEQDVDSLIAALQSLDTQTFDPSVVRRNAERFDVERFEREFAAFVVGAWERFTSN
jgi:glycosyltransferase involved in cell wall biosynthesis